VPKSVESRFLSCPTWSMDYENNCHLPAGKFWVLIYI